MMRLPKNCHRFVTAGRSCCHPRPTSVQQSQILRTLSSNSSSNYNRRSNNSSNNYNSSATSQSQQYYDVNIGGNTGSTMTSRSSSNNKTRSPIVLTNMKSSNTTATTTSNTSNYSSNYRQQQQGPSSTSSVFAAQLPRVLSRLSILKYRHSPLLADVSSKHSDASRLKFPDIPQLSKLFTNFNHGGGIGSSTRMFSSSSSSIDHTDGETIASDTKPEEQDTSMPFKVLLYAVYGRRDFMEIQRTNYVERPVSSKSLDDVLEEQEKEELAREAANNPVPDEEIKDAEDDDDDDDEEDEMVTFAMEADLFSLSEIQSTAEEQFGTSKNLQYYHTGINEWRNLHDENDLDLFQTFYFECIDIYKASKTRVVVPIRIPEYYVEEEDDPDDEDDPSLHGASSNIHTLEAMIERLLKQLIDSKWMCEEHNPMTVKIDGSDASDPPPSSDSRRPETFRLMKEVLHDSSTGIIIEPMSVEPTATTTPATSNDETKVVSSTDDSTTSTETTAKSTTSNSIDDVTAVASTDALVSETTTIMPDDKRPTITKTFMYMNTKDFVMSCAAKDAALRGLLFYYPNSLDHIVECLHYKFLWDNYYLKDVAPVDRDQYHPSSDENGTESGEDRPDEEGNIDGRGAATERNDVDDTGNDDVGKREAH